MQYKRHLNRKVVRDELNEIVTFEQKENLIRILKEKLCGASKNILSVKNVQILESGLIEFTCKTLWDCDNVCENDTIIMDIDDDRTQGTCLRGMSSVYIGDVRIYDDGRHEYAGIDESVINSETGNRYYFSFCGSGKDYEDYYIFDTKYKLPYEKQIYPGIMF